MAGAGKSPRKVTNLKAKKVTPAKAGQVKAGQTLTPRDPATGLPTGKRGH